MGVAHEVLQRARSLVRPCLRLARAERRSTTHIGGLPELPNGVKWPSWKGKPLSFVAQLDLGAAPDFEWPEWTPREGRLLFFYDVTEQPWGYDPEDRGCCAVIYVPPGAAVAERLPPEDVPIHGRFRRKDMRFVPHLSYPSYERLVYHRDSRVATTENDFNEITEELDALEPVEDSGSGQLHRLFGWPQPVQGDDMELEAQFASNGLYCGDAKAHLSPEAERLEPGAADWQLLFQLDSDDDTDMMWGDAGMLYFWVRREDAARKDFSTVWLVLQCC
jgi:uncharacterized protein YwqG